MNMTKTLLSVMLCCCCSIMAFGQNMTQEIEKIIDYPNVSMIEIKGHFRAELTRDKAVLMFNENCEKEMKISIGYYYDGFDDFKRILSEKSGLTFETKDY